MKLVKLAPPGSKPLMRMCPREITQPGGATFPSGLLYKRADKPLYIVMVEQGYSRAGILLDMPQPLLVRLSSFRLILFQKKLRLSVNDYHSG